LMIPRCLPPVPLRRTVPVGWLVTSSLSMLTALSTGYTTTQDPGKLENDSNTPHVIGLGVRNTPSIFIFSYIGRKKTISHPLLKILLYKSYII